MRRAVLLLWSSALVLAGCATQGDGASASCVGPDISLSTGSAPPQGRLVVSGSGFLSTCYDTVQNGQAPARNLPATGVRVVFSQGGRTEDLGRADADDQYALGPMTVTVPGWATAGPATVSTSDAPSAVTLMIVAPPG